MNKVRLLSILCFILMPLFIQAQSSTAPLNDDYYHLIDRYEIKSGKLSESFCVTSKPFQRKAIMNLVDSTLGNHLIPLNSRDFFNLEYLRQDSWEYSNKRTLTSKKPFLKRFYQNPSDYYHTKNQNFDIHLSPVTHFIWGTENNTPTNLWLTARGVELRGQIGGKLGFYSYVTDTQGTFGEYVRDYNHDLLAIRPRYTENAYLTPGEGLAKQLRRTGVDFISARGYVTFNPIKQMNIQFGHDRNFVGSGFRSMLLSDFSSPYLFAKITTNLGRFQYTNLFCSLLDDQTERFRDTVLTKKYAAIHHLSIRFGKNFQLGVFEAEVLGRDKKEGFDWNYLNPIIFYRFVESQIGSGDNALLGFDFRWNFLKKFGFYSQIMLDEFKTSLFFGKSANGSWAQKYGFQAGLKYIDAFGIKNLDLQTEYNLVRPYTYAHKTSLNNYVHFNQPLAHPYGANFWELLGIVRYQPLPRLTFYGTFLYSNRGFDSPDKGNWGGNILRSYNDSRVRDFGNQVAQGIPVTTLYSDMRLTYMARHNFFIDGRLLFREQTSTLTKFAKNTTLATIAFRLNIPNRQQVF
jgi:hypothetical protein